jgi:hypothetical protein
MCAYEANVNFIDRLGTLPVGVVCRGSSDNAAPEVWHRILNVIERLHAKAEDGRYGLGVLTWSSSSSCWPISIGRKPRRWNPAGFLSGNREPNALARVSQLTGRSPCPHMRLVVANRIGRAQD